MTLYIYAFVVYFIVGCIVRAGWYKFSSDERVLWALVFWPHALLIRLSYVKWSRCRIDVDQLEKYFSIFFIAATTIAHILLVDYLHDDQKMPVDEAIKTSLCGLLGLWFASAMAAGVIELWFKLVKFFGG